MNVFVAKVVEVSASGSRPRNVSYMIWKVLCWPPPMSTLGAKEEWEEARKRKRERVAKRERAGGWKQAQKNKVELETNV